MQGIRILSKSPTQALLAVVQPPTAFVAEGTDRASNSVQCVSISHIACPLTSVGPLVSISMQIQTLSKRRKVSVGGSLVAPDSDPAYRIRLSLYPNPPTEEITLEEFEEYAIARLQVLKELEAAQNMNIPSEQRLHRLDKVLRKYLPLPRDGTPEARFLAIRKDVISHFVLRLAYRNPNDRDWFVRQERALLEIRLRIEKESDPSFIRRFVEDNGLQFEKLSPQEWEQYFPQIRRTVQSYRSQQDNVDPNKDHYYRIPFELASELVQTRRVFLAKGFAYVHEDDLITIMMSQYRQDLLRALERAMHRMPAFKDERIDPLLAVIPKQYIGKDYSQVSSSKKHKINIMEIDSVAKRSFPMCMRSLHMKLRANHHLRHQARMQYGLFLKGIGVTLEDSLDFWRREIVQKYGEDGWRKKGYAYNIKHNYGMEGKRASYTPFSCQKIINFDVLPGEDHGCPFRHRDNTALQQHFYEAGIRDNDSVSELMQLIRDRHYQEACKRYYDFLHPNAPEYIQNHPNKYFEESMSYFERKQGGSGSVASSNTSS